MTNHVDLQHCHNDEDAVDDDDIVDGTSYHEDDDDGGESSVDQPLPAPVFTLESSDESDSSSCEEGGDCDSDSDSSEEGEDDGDDSRHCQLPDDNDSVESDDSDDDRNEDGEIFVLQPNGKPDRDAGMLLEANFVADRR